MGYGVFVLENKIKFIIVTTAYNVSDWIAINMNSIQEQTYTDYIHIIVNDNSNDNTCDIINSNLNDRCVLLNNNNNGSQCKSFLYAWDWINDNDFDDECVIVEVDGDDWLHTNDVLDYLNGVYISNENTLMTCGQYIVHPTHETGGHYHGWNNWVNQYVDDNNLYRTHQFPYSHLKTYKLNLLNKVLKFDLFNIDTDDYFDCIFDHVLCLPMVEMTGIDRIIISDRILYVLNRTVGLGNEGSMYIDKQKEVEISVRNNIGVYNRL